MLIDHHNVTAIKIIHVCITTLQAFQTTLIVRTLHEKINARCMYSLKYHVYIMVQDIKCITYEKMKYIALWFCMCMCLSLQCTLPTLYPLLNGASLWIENHGTGYQWMMDKRRNINCCFYQHFIYVIFCVQVVSKLSSRNF